METDTAVGAVLDIFRRAAGDNPPFPPAELFSEGWMLRSLMDAHVNGLGGLPIPHHPDTAWYSEARLVSPFQPSHRGDPRGEGITHADGVIGHFGIRDQTTAGLHLEQTGQFVVIEAKMGSNLAPGTTRVRWFDQAARNIAAMAWTIAINGHRPDEFTHLGFVVVAPEGRLSVEPSFAAYTAKESVAAKVGERIKMYRVDDPARYLSLVRFGEEVFDPFLERLEVTLLSWEEAIGSVVDPDLGASLEDFFQRCLRYAVPDRRGMSGR